MRQQLFRKTNTTISVASLYENFIMKKFSNLERVSEDGEKNEPLLKAILNDYPLQMLVIERYLTGSITHYKILQGIKRIEHVVNLAKREYEAETTLTEEEKIAFWQYAFPVVFIQKHEGQLTPHEIREIQENLNI